MPHDPGSRTRLALFAALGVAILGGMGEVAISLRDVGNDDGPALIDPDSQIDLIGDMPMTSTTPAAALFQIGETYKPHTLRWGILGRHLTPNDKQSIYTVWLYTSPKQVYRLRTALVGKSRVLQTNGTLPGNVKAYKELVVSVEGAKAKPARPTKIILRGPLAPIIGP